MIPTLLVQLMLPLMTSSPALAAEGVLRHALLVGVNDGGPGMEPLRIYWIAFWVRLLISHTRRARLLVVCSASLCFL